MRLLLVPGFRTYPSTANRHKKNGAPDQESSHHSYEVPSANYDAPAFPYMCPLLLAPLSMPHPEPWRISTLAYSPAFGEGIFSELRIRDAA